MDEELSNKYLEMTDNEINKLLLNGNTDIKQTNRINSACECVNKDYITDNIKKHIVCINCGVVINENIEAAVEYNEGGDNNSKYGPPTSYFFPKSSLGTKIAYHKYNRLCLIQKQGQMPYKEKSLMESLINIQIKFKIYNIPQTIIDCAKILYKKISESIHTSGKRKGKYIIMRCINRKSIVAACLFYACKFQHETRSPKEIADIYNLEIKNVNKGCRKFCDIIEPNILFYQIKSSMACDFIERFSNNLNLNKKYIGVINDVSNNIHKLELNFTHEPPSIAAGCILLIINIYNIDISKKLISDIFGLSDVTISKTFRKILQWKEIVLNNKITDLIVERIKNYNYSL